MARVQSKGVCVFCQRAYSKGGMSRHLAACKARPAEKGSSKIFHLQAEGLYAAMYWLHLEMPGQATLQDLDIFLRDIWVECCGHLSMFEIEGQRYTQIFDDGWFPDDKDMNVRLSRILRPGLQFGYEYDFGTTTELKLKVVAERAGAKLAEPVRILARNNPPDIPCQSCGKPATQVCSMCIWQGEGWLCDDCAGQHGCGEDYFLPVVNSPRVGMCGYVG